MLTVGLTGGIGAGKSAVTSLLAAHGASVVDADELARQVVAPGTAGLADVIRAFGPGVLLPDGRLDRTGLGRQVFADPDALARLNAILHPLIAERTAEAFAAARAAGVRVLVHDVPLLVEARLAPGYDVVVVVDTEPEVQLQRLMEHRGMSHADAMSRMAVQATRAERLAVADEVVHNDGTPADLAAQVERLWQRLVAHDGAKEA